MRKRSYYIINIVILLFTIGFFVQSFFQNLKLLDERKNITIIFAGTLIGIVIVHLFKGIRLYFLVLEKRPTVARFLRLYVKTSLVNLVFPFKLGEIFRIYSFGYEWKSYKAGLLLILVDRYFDTIPLLLLLIGFTIIERGTLYGIVVVLTIFIAVITVIYFIFPSTYKYMNRFLIVNTNSERGLNALSILKKIRFWYLYVKELIDGRELILIVLSVCAWLAEYGSLYCLISGLGYVFKTSYFLDYMNSVFIGRSNEYVGQYIGVSALILVIASGIVYGRQFARRKRK